MPTYRVQVIVSRVVQVDVNNSTPLTQEQIEQLAIAQAQRENGTELDYEVLNVESVLGES